MMWKVEQVSAIQIFSSNTIYVYINVRVTHYEWDATHLMTFSKKQKNAA